MTLAAEVEKLRSYPTVATADFREQLERVRTVRNRLVHSNSDQVGDKGIDRSRELTPIMRPTIVRTLADT